MYLVLLRQCLLRTAIVTDCRTGVDLSTNHNRPKPDGRAELPEPPLVDASVHQVPDDGQGNEREKLTHARLPFVCAGSERTYQTCIKNTRPPGGGLY